MGATTEIAWSDSTFNGWIGCSKISDGCTNCYAEAQNTRFKGGNWGPGAPRRRTSEANWRQPLKWEREHEQFFAEHGRRRRVFCASLADVFDNEVDPAWRKDLFALIEATPNLDWLLLTKRIGNVQKMLNEVAHPDPSIYVAYIGRLPENVWLGITVVNQLEADRDIPKLLSIPARVRFLSMEPLLDSVDITPFVTKPIHPNPGYLPRISWVIVGGESGANARPMELAWARSLRDQCVAAGVPFFFKQWGEYAPSMICSGTEINFKPVGGMRESYFMTRIGKKRAGRLLDFHEWNEFPEAPHANP